MSKKVHLRVFYSLSNIEKVFKRRETDDERYQIHIQTNGIKFNLSSSVEYRYTSSEIINIVLPEKIRSIDGVEKSTYRNIVSIAYSFYSGKKLIRNNIILFWGLVIKSFTWSRYNLSLGFAFKLFKPKITVWKITLWGFVFVFFLILFIDFTLSSHPPLIL